MDQPVDAFARNLPKKAVPVDLNTAEGRQCPLCSTVLFTYWTRDGICSWVSMRIIRDLSEVVGKVGWFVSYQDLCLIPA